MNIAECKQRWPILFKDYLPGRGIEFQQGWDPIVEELCEKLETLNQSRAEGQGFIHCIQAKEKFGGLRFYESYPGDIAEEVKSLIEETLEKADRTCEICGKPGVLRKGGYWYKTVCDEHAKELDYDKIVVAEDDEN